VKKKSKVLLRETAYKETPTNIIPPTTIVNELQDQI
jgi:hypothetical protein